jgi:2-C-methyl-D-erythritol 4-phosphate cytidylyltransferase
MKVFVIIPAAGLGTRMTPATTDKEKKNIPSKQFTELHGTPILIHTLRAFAGCPEVTEICIALRQDEIHNFQARLEKDGQEILAK